MNGDSQEEIATPPRAGATGTDGWWGRTAVVVLLTATVVVPVVYVPAYYGAVVGKAVLYRVLVDAALAIWLAGVASGRIRVTWSALIDPIGGALAAFTVWGTVTSFLGYAPVHSLFGELTRMWGAMTWWHLLAFYVVARTIFRRPDWRRFFGWAFGVSVLVVALTAVMRTPAGAALPLPAGPDGLMAGRWSGLVGNPGFMAAYLLVAIGIGGWLFVTSDSTRCRALIGLGILLDAAALMLTSQRAAMGGLAVAVLVGLAAYGLLVSERRKRIASASVLAVLIAVGAGVRLQPDAGWVQRVPGLSRVATVDLDTSTLRDRLIAWEAAYEGVSERPGTGVGFENFKVVFDRHFEPQWYENTGDTPWDRPHNAFIGAFVSGGIPGGIAYLALFAAGLFGVWSAFRRDDMDAAEAAVVLAVIVGYGVQLFFWFEDHSSFSLFGALLAFVATRAWSPDVDKGAGDEDVSGRPRILEVGLAVLLIGGAAVAAWLHHLEYVRSGWAVRQAHDAGPLRDGVSHFERAVAHRPPGEDEVPSEYARLMGNPPSTVMQPLRRGAPVSDPIRRGLEGSFTAITVAIDENPKDSRLLMSRARLYLTTSLMQRDTAYYRSAGRDIKKAIKLAPNRITYYQILADWYLFGERPDLALNAMRVAAQKYAGLPETQFYLAKTYAAEGRPAEAVDHFVRAAELGHPLEPASVVENALSRLPGEYRESARDRICTPLGGRAPRRSFCFSEAG